MQFGDGAWRCVIPTNVMGGTVVVTQGESVWAQGAVAAGLDLAGGTSKSMFSNVSKAFRQAAARKIRTCRDIIILAIDAGTGVSYNAGTAPVWHRKHSAIHQKKLFRAAYMVAQIRGYADVFAMSFSAAGAVCSAVAAAWQPQHPFLRLHQANPSPSQQAKRVKTLAVLPIANSNSSSMCS